MQLDNITLTRTPDFRRIPDWESLFDSFVSVNGLPTNSNRMTCPCASYHTTPSRPTDFYVTLNTKYPAPDGFVFLTTSCWHNSCQSARRVFVKHYNKKWVSFVRNNADASVPNIVRPVNWVELELQRVKDKWVRFEKCVKQRREIERILRPVFDTPLSEPVFCSPEEDVQRHVSMFQTGDILFWGSPLEAENCYVVGQEITSTPNFTSSYTFKLINGSFNRDTEHCHTKPYMVLEMDDGSPKGLQLNRLLAVASHFKVPLLMALDSGGKSIHGWFHQKDLELFLDFLGQMGYDMKTATSRSQPVRLAGAYRAEKNTYQRIIYWNYEPRL